MTFAIKANPKKGGSQKNKLIVTMRDSIEGQRSQAAQQTRMLSEEQAKWWRKIPYLALQAQWKTAHVIIYEIAYKTGYWLLKSSNRMGDAPGTFTAMVDCETGRIFFPTKLHGEDDFSPAFARDLLFIDLDELDAETIVKGLQAEALLVEQNSVFVPDEAENIRVANMQRKREASTYRVSKIYKRKK